MVKRGNNSGICRSRYSNFQVSFCFGFKWSEAKNWKMNWYLVENAFVTKNSCLILCTLVISFALHNQCPYVYLVSTKTSTYFSPLIFQIWCIISSWWSLWANFYHPLVVYVSTASCCKSQVCMAISTVIHCGGKNVMSSGREYMPNLKNDRSKYISSVFGIRYIHNIRQLYLVITASFTK